MARLGRCVDHALNRTEDLSQYFENLLQEAVLLNSYAGVEMLLQYEMVMKSKMAESHPNKYRQKCTRPLVTAAEQGQMDLIKLFLKYQYTISQPHVTGCECDVCADDKLGQQLHRLSTLKALSNPVWIALTSDDPFLTSFKLQYVVKKFSTEDDSFEHEYKELLDKSISFCKKLLDEVKAEREGALLMKCKSCSETNEDGSDLLFIDVAIDYCQKEVVAHPVVQHFLTSRVFDNIPGWRTSGIIYKVFLVFLTGLLYPVTTLLNIMLPSSCRISDVAMNPFVKFMNGAASFITFLIILSVSGTRMRTRVEHGGTCPNCLEWTVFVWVVGFCYGEFQQLYKLGVFNYLHNGWNWVDIGMDSLMMFSYCVWIILCVRPPEDPHHYDNLVYIADGAFSIGIILSFFRVIYLCQITSYLGLLQLCLGEMIMVILQFAFICIIVLLSFTIAMTFLFHSSDHHEKVVEEYQNHNKTEIYKALSENFNGFWATLFTMMWVSFSLKDSETVEDFADGTLIHLWANMLFIAYFGITMIVVLNMLIAMMNNSYQNIADNISTEHKYSRTRLWMEYVGDEQTRPVPFNLLPTVDGIKRFLANAWNAIYNCNCSATNSEGQLLNQEREARRRHKQLCDILMDRYIQKNYGFSINDEPLAKSGKRSFNDPFLQKVRNSFEVWKIYQETGELIPPSSLEQFREDNNSVREGVLDETGQVTAQQSQQFYVSEEGDDPSPPVWKDFLVL